MHHVYLDVFSFATILVELESILQGKENQLPLAVSLAGLAQFLGEKKKENMADIQQFWKGYALPWNQLRAINLSLVEEEPPVLWSMWELSSVVKKKALDEIACSHSISTAMVIYTAWALALSKYTASDTVGMKASVSGGTLDYPFIENVLGGVNGWCPLIVQLD